MSGGMDSNGWQFLFSQRVAVCLQVVVHTLQSSARPPPLTHGEIARAVAHSDDADAPTP